MVETPELCVEEWYRQNRQSLSGSRSYKVLVHTMLRNFVASTPIRTLDELADQFWNFRRDIKDFYEVDIPLLEGAFFVAYAVPDVVRADLPVVIGIQSRLN
jgi:hypothetical protein